MARWDVTGVDHKTGSERTIRVSGDTERAAMLEARAAGILSTRVTLIPGEGGPTTAEAKPEQAPAVVLSYSGQYDIPPTDPRQPPSPRSSRDRYPDVRIAGGVIEVGAVLIGIGLIDGCIAATAHHLIPSHCRCWRKYCPTIREDQQIRHLLLCCRHEAMGSHVRRGCLGRAMHGGGADNTRGR